jgi:putative FmdB family regulatory protein
MPTYEYDCPTCGLVEHYQSIKSDTLKICPQCEQAPVTRRIGTGGAVLFKGDGFWETDYNRSKDYQSKSKSDAAAAKPPSTDSKPAAAPSEAAKPQATPAASAPAVAPSAPAKSDTPPTKA